MKRFLFPATALTIALLSVGCADVAVNPHVDGRLVGAVELDLATGEGFVGKGDVQDLFGWNDHELQENADLIAFRLNSVQTTVDTWECTKDNGNTQTRTRTTTSSVVGDLVVEVRRNPQGKATGFLLLGFDEGGSVSELESDGPALNSCPGDNANSQAKSNGKSSANSSAGWTLTAPATSTVLSQEGGGLEASPNAGATWTVVPLETEVVL